MFVVASFSLRSLLDFLPLVRGGEGAGKPSDSDFPSDLEEELREEPAWAVGSSSSVRTSLLASGGAALGVSAFTTWSATTVFRGMEGPGGFSSCTGASVAGSTSVS